MIGTKSGSIVLQKRDLALFRILWLLRVADREQIKMLAGFTSTTRINLRLLKLTRAGFLRRFFVGTAVRKAIYALSAKAAELIGVSLRGPRRKQDETLVADYFIEHQLAINNLYCSFKAHPIPIAEVTFRDWQSFHQAIVPGLRLIPDGYAEFNTPEGVLSTFLEVDLGHESLKIWKEKVTNYLRLATSGEFEKRFKNSRFRVCVIARSERRTRSIRQAVRGLTTKLFWFTSLDHVEANGFFGPIWLRLIGENVQGFVQTP